MPFPLRHSDPDDKFLAEKFSLRYVASGRDMTHQVADNGSKDFVIFANPLFNLLTAPNSQRTEDPVCN